MKTGTIKQHTNAYDYLRICAAFAVVFMHTAAPALASVMNTDWYFLSLFTSLFFTAVPLFFMMSGDLMMNSPRTCDITYLIKKRLPRLLVPLCSWTGIYAVWYVRSELNLQTVGTLLVKALREPIAPHLHFMYTLLVLYAISPLLVGAVKSLNQAGRRYAFALILLVTLRAMVVSVFPAWKDSFAAVDFVVSLEFVGCNLCTFLLGYFLATTKKKVPNWVLFLNGILLLAVITLGTWQHSAALNTYQADFQNQRAGFEVLLAGCIFLLCRQKLSQPRPRLQRILAPVVALTYPLYLVHVLLLELCYAVGIYPLTFSGVTLLTVVVFFAALVGMITLTTVKPLCYLFTGIPYEDACRRCNWIALWHMLRSGK